jgi:hypothetical protein
MYCFLGFEFVGPHTVSKRRAVSYIINDSDYLKTIILQSAPNGAREVLTVHLTPYFLGRRRFWNIDLAVLSVLIARITFCSLPIIPKLSPAPELIPHTLKLAQRLTHRG